MEGLKEATDSMRVCKAASTLSSWACTMVSMASSDGKRYLKVPKVGGIETGDLV